MRFAWLAVLCLVSATPCAARSYGVEDMLALEDYGRALFAPAGDRVVVERLAGQTSAARFTYDFFVRRARSRIMTATVSGTSGLKPLFAQEPGAGYWLGSFSPSGRRLTVYRLKDDHVALGVVDVAAGRVRWLPVTPDFPSGRVNPEWIDEDRLVLIALPPGELPLSLDFAGRAQKQLMRLWADTALGQVPAMSIVGSGADLQAGITHRRRSLVLVDLRTGIRSLATGDFTDFSVSPDHAQIALAERADAVPEPPASERISLDFQSRRLRLRIVGLSGAERAPCPGCDLAPDFLAWSGDGSHLLVFARHDGDGWDAGHLYRYDVGADSAAPLETGQVVPSLVRTTPGRSTARAGWFGTIPLVFGTSGSKRADWFLLGERGPVRLTAGIETDTITPLSTGRTGLCLVNPDGFWSIRPDGTSRLVFPKARTADVEEGGYDVGTRLLFEPVRGRASLWLSEPDDRGRHILEGDCDRALVRPVGRIEAGATLLAVADAAPSMLVSRASSDGSTMLAFAGSQARTLDRINMRAAGIDPPEPLALHRTGPAGPQTDWLLLPPHADPAARLPLIVMPYPGIVYGDLAPSDFSLTDFEPMLSPPLLAAHGYAVLAPSLPIGTKEPAEDIIAALRPAIGAAVASGRIDPARIGVLGHSYGGYTALLMATEFPCLRSVVASASIADLLQMYGSLDPRIKIDMAEGFPPIYPFGWSEDGQGRMGMPPWRDPDLYIRNSPFYRLDRVKAPILMLHGDLDPLSVTQVERTFAALYRLGKTARLVRYYGEGHVPQSPATIHSRWTETFAWFDRTMAAKPAAGALSFDATGTCAASAP